MMTVHQVVNVDYDMQEHTPGVYAKINIGLEIRSVVKIFRFLERILKEDIDTKSSLGSKLQAYSICSIGTRSGN